MKLFHLFLAGGSGLQQGEEGIIALLRGGPAGIRVHVLGNVIEAQGRAAVLVLVFGVEAGVLRRIKDGRHLKGMFRFPGFPFRPGFLIILQLFPGGGVHVLRYALGLRQAQHCAVRVFHRLHLALLGLDKFVGLRLRAAQRVQPQEARGIGRGAQQRHDGRRQQQGFAQLAAGLDLAGHGPVQIQQPAVVHGADGLQQFGVFHSNPSSVRRRCSRFRVRKSMLLTLLSL